MLLRSHVIPGFQGNRCAWNAACCKMKSEAAQEEMQMFNPGTMVRKRNIKERRIDLGRKRMRGRERTSACMREKQRKKEERKWVKSYQFLPMFRRKYVFIISFTFDYIPFVTEISAPPCETPLCREPLPGSLSRCRKHPSSMLFSRDKCPWYGAAGRVQSACCMHVCVRVCVYVRAFRFARARILFFHGVARTALIKIDYAVHYCS